MNGDNRTHGGDWAGYAREYGREALDFSANVSPLGVPEGVRAALCAAAACADRYPDPECRALTAALAAREGVPESWIRCGAGASELLWSAVRAAAPKRALLAVPCFGEYAAALAAADCAVTEVPLGDGFRLERGFLSRIDRSVDLVILCDPNNPTGLTIDPVLLRALVARCGEAGCRLVLDECFIDFLDEPERYTAKGLLAGAPWLLLLRAFTKLYGLAGVRAGWALCADAAFLERMRRVTPPWTVSVPAQAAACAALEETDYADRVRALVRTERRRLLDGLCALGLRTVAGEANFLLFQSPVPLARALGERGILIRCCGSFAGLDESWYRVAVRRAEENDALLAALKEVLS